MSEAKDITITIYEYVDLTSRISFAEGALAGLGVRLAKLERCPFSSEKDKEIKEIIADVEDARFMIGTTAKDDEDPTDEVTP